MRKTWLKLMYYWSRSLQLKLYSSSASYMTQIDVLLVKFFSTEHILSNCLKYDTFNVLWVVFCSTEHLLSKRLKYDPNWWPFSSSSFRSTPEHLTRILTGSVTAQGDYPCRPRDSQRTSGIEKLRLPSKVYMLWNQATNCWQRRSSQQTPDVHV